jgi:hypothetical protein
MYPTGFTAAAEAEILSISTAGINACSTPPQDTAMLELLYAGDGKHLQSRGDGHAETSARAVPRFS